MAPPLAMASRRKPDARMSSMNLSTAARTSGLSFGTTMFCGTLKKLSGSSRVPGMLRDQVVSRWRLAPKRVDLAAGRWPWRARSGLLSSSTRRGLLQHALEAERDGVVPRAGDLADPPRSMSATALIGEPSSTRKRLLHQHVGLRELDRAEPRRLIGDEADIGLPAPHRLDHRRRIGRRLEVERLADALGKLGREIEGGAAHLAGLGVANRLRRIGREIGRAERAGRRDVLCACGDNGGEHEARHDKQTRSHKAPGRSDLRRGDFIRRALAAD